MENRTLVIADEMFGPRGEAAELFSQLLLCLEPERPRQFVFNTPLYGSIESLYAKQELDIIGKQAGRIIFGVGLRELRRGVPPEELFNLFRKLILDVSVRITAEIYLVTIPEAASPNTPFSINHWNDLIGTLQSSNIILLDFAKEETLFQQRQLARGKFVRNLWNEEGEPTPMCLTLLALFLQKSFMKNTYLK